MKLNFKRTDLFFAFVYINVFCKGIGLDSGSKIYLVLLVLGVLALILKLLGDKYNKKELGFVAIAAFIGGMTFITTKKPTLLLTCLCLAGMKNIDLEKIFKGMYKIRLVTFFSVITLSLLGFISNYCIEMWRSGRMDVRYSLGFSHPNELHLSLFILLSLFIYVKYKNLRLFHYVFMILLNCFIYYYSGSRTGVVAVFLLIILTFISKLNIRKINKLLIKTPKYIFLALVIFSFVTGSFYGKHQIFNKLNSLFNGRIVYSNYYLTHYGLSPFGNDILSDTNALFDNGYIYLYIQFGICGIAFISYLLLKTFKNVENNFDISKSILLIIFLIYIFTESFSPNIFMNIILMFAAPIIFGSNTQKEEINE